MLILQYKTGLVGAAPPVPGYVLWLDGQDTSTMYSDIGGTTAAVVDGPVRRWDDKSGNAHHVTNASVGVDTPTLRDGNIDPYTSLEFNGSSADTLFNTTGNPLTAGAGRTIFVLAVDGAGGGAGTLVQIRRTSLFFTVQEYAGSNVYTDGVNAANNATADFTGVSWANPLVFIYRSSGSGNPLRMFLNGSEKTVTHGGGSVATESGSAGFTIGNRADVGAQGWTGDIGEVIIYNTELSDLDQASVLAFLTAKWGL